MAIDPELIDKLLAGYKKPEQIIGKEGLLKQLTKQLLERAMAAEMTEHVGYEKHDPGGHNSGNSRNGKSAKTIKSYLEAVDLYREFAVRVGMLANYASAYRRAVRHAWQHGEIEAAFNIGFVGRHLIEFTREALRGEQNASFYSGAAKTQPSAPRPMRRP